MGGSHRAVDRGVRQPSDREEALQKFRLAIDGDPLLLTVELTKSLHHASRNLGVESGAQLLASQFIKSVPVTVSQQLNLVNTSQPMC